MTTAGQAASDPHASLQHVISGPRFQTFLTAAGNQPELGRKLYVWNRDLSVAILADIAILEVALRNAMHDAASSKWGTHWYADAGVSLDERSANQLSGAWGHLPDTIKQRASDPDVPGRLVAQCMFGFWTNLLDAGSHIGKQPRRTAVDYETLWQAAFKWAFPGGRIEARAQRAIAIAALPATASRAAEETRLRQEVAFTRSWVHGVCRNVNYLRNRVAHHEPLINGFPLNGQKQRMSPAEGHEQCRLLARMLDTRLANWLDSNSAVPALLSSRPSK